MTRKLTRQLPDMAGAIRTVGRAIFGDRAGVVVFLAGLVFLTAYWRVGIFLTDSYAVGNTLANVADGHLEITRLQYSVNFASQPGLHFHDGVVYGRNYGHAIISLPVLWFFEGASAVFDPRLVLVAFVSLLVVLLFEQCGRLRDNYRPYAIAGNLTAGGFVLLNALVAYPLDPNWYPFVALQLTSIVATAMIGVLLYRLVANLSRRRVGAVVGFVAVAATPLGFWASIPKRHTFTALTVAVLLAGFYYARGVDASRTTVARVLPYGAIALLAWIHAPEALILLVAFVPVDLATAPSNRPRQLAVVGVVFLVALTPFLATNYAISGNPAQPPRMLSTFDGQISIGEVQSTGAASAEQGVTGPANATTGSAGATPAGDSPPDTPPDETTQTAATPPPESAATGTETGGAGAGGGSSGNPVVAVVLSLLGLAGAVVDASLAAASKFAELYGGGIPVLVEEPERLYHTFVRSGRIPLDRVRYDFNQQEAIELTVVETAPLVAGVVGSVAVGVRRLGSTAPSALAGRVRAALDRPERQTDLLAVVVVVVFTLAYLSRLPFHSQLTVRYLVPLLPIWLYSLARLPFVARTLTADWRWLAGPYLGGLLAGGAGLLLVHGWLGLAVGEAMQFHGLLGLASALPLAVWALAGGVGREIDHRVGGVVLATPAAVTTLFVLATGLGYFQYGDYALPIVRSIAELLPVAV